MKKKNIKIVNSGTKEFPMYQVIIDGNEFCATEHLYNAEVIVKLFAIPDVSNMLNCNTCHWYKSKNQAAPCNACHGRNKHVLAI